MAQRAEGLVIETHGITSTEMRTDFYLVMGVFFHFWSFDLRCVSTAGNVFDNVHMLGVFRFGKC